MEYASPDVPPDVPPYVPQDQPQDASISASGSGLSIRELEAQITELAGHLNAANHRWLVLIAEFDRRNGWSDGVTQSCAHWLSWKCGLDLGAAREKVRVARAIESLSKISAAMANGRLSYSKARQHSQRRLTYFHDHDGSLVVKLQLTAENGALFLKAIEAALPEIPLPDDCKDSLHVSAETSAGSFDAANITTAAMRRADAVIVMAETLLQHGAAALKGGDRHQIVVHIDDATLRKGEAGRCELDDGPAVPVETARRFSCDCSKVEITEDEQGEPLDVGRKTRSIPPALRRALASRDKGCVFPGCNHKRYVDGHHVEHWADGGETKLSNLATLCRFHHRSVHEGGLKMERCDDGAWRFTNARGESLHGCAPGHTQPLADWRQLPAEHAERGIHIDPDTATTGWRGERMDYSVAIDSLRFRSAAYKRVERGGET